MKFFEVFKAGNYPQGNFSVKDVEILASNYDANFSEAPITLDHEQKGPAYGWVSGLKSENGKLKASFRDVTDELKEYVQSGKYKKISVEIYKELEGRKPYLKAVSFLGAAIPQIKGMEPVEFKEGETETYIFEIKSSETKNENKELLELQRQITEVEDKIKLFANKTETSEIVSYLQGKIEELSGQVSKISNNLALKDDIELELKKFRQETKQAEFELFLDQQLSLGKLTPSQKDISIKILMTLDNIATFTEGENLVGDFRAFLKSLPKQIEFDEIVTKDKQTPEQDFLNFAGADEYSLEIYKAAKLLSAKENIPFKDALLKIYK